MRHTTLFLLLTTLLLVITSYATFAQGKVTDDPNAAPREEETEEEVGFYEKDPRLSQEVTYQAERKPVREIIDDISELTGVRMFSGHNSKDWQVRDRRMNIYVENEPLAELMQSIARVMKFKWSRSGDEPDWSYRIFMDRRTVLEAEAKRQREIEAAKESESRGRRKLIEDFGKLSELGENEIEKLRETDPFKYIAAKTGIAEGIAGFIRESPEALSALARGEELSLYTGDLSKEARDNLYEMAVGIDKVMRKMMGRDSKIDYAKLKEEMLDTNVRVNKFLEYARESSTPQSLLLGSISIDTDQGVGMLGVPFYNPESSVTKIIGEALVRVFENDEKMQDVMMDLQPRIMKAMAEEQKKLSGDEEGAEKPADEALDVPIEWEGYVYGYSELTVAVGENSDFNMVTDDFGHGYGAYKPKKDTRLQDVVDRIEKNYQKDLTRVGDTLEFTDKKWYHKRMAQIPDAWIDAWLAELKENGTLDLDTLSSISRLTIEQINTAFRDSGQESIIGGLFGNRYLLRFYSMLTPAQRQQMFSAGGLDVAVVSPDALYYLNKCFNDSAKFFSNPDATITLSASRDKKEENKESKDDGSDKVHSYTFVLSTTDDYTPSTWHLTTPRYLDKKEVEDRKNKTREQMEKFAEKRESGAPEKDEEPDNTKGDKPVKVEGVAPEKPTATEND